MIAAKLVHRGSIIAHLGKLAEWVYRWGLRSSSVPEKIAVVKPRSAGSDRVKVLLKNACFCAIVALLLKRMTQEQEQGRKFRVTPLDETDESITLQVSRAEGETLIVKFAPATKEVSFRFGAGEQEAGRENEPQEITIEGRIARNRWAKYSAKEQRYSNRLAFQPDENNTNLAWFYDFQAEGELADYAWQKLRLNQAGERVVVSGWLIKEHPDKGTTGLIKADYIGRLPPGQKPSHTILPERLKPSANGGER